MSCRRSLVALAALAAFAVPSARVTAADPADVFAKNCAACHGKEGKPSPVFAKQGVRDFTDAAWQKATSDAQIEKTIREGKKGTMMAAFQSRLTPEEIKGLVGYIRKLGGKK